MGGLQQIAFAGPGRSLSILWKPRCTQMTVLPRRAPCGQQITPNAFRPLYNGSIRGARSGAVFSWTLLCPVATRLYRGRQPFPALSHPPPIAGANLARLERLHRFHHRQPPSLLISGVATFHRPTLAPGPRPRNQHRHLSTQPCHWPLIGPLVDARVARSPALPLSVPLLHALAVAVPAIPPEPPVIVAARHWAVAAAVQWAPVEPVYPDRQQRHQQGQEQL